MTALGTTETAEPLPVTIVSGYLGAGKTTLVNSILSGDHGLHVAVLVNDFGRIAIDETLIGGRDGDVIALANGCMCCQIGGDLYDAIDRILRMRVRFDHLLIETSGVADPAKVAQIAVAEPELEMTQTIVLVDAINFLEILNDPRLEDTLLRQLRGADCIFFTKTDEPSAASVPRLQASITEAGIASSGSVLKKGQPDHWRLLRRKSPEIDRSSKAAALKSHALPFDSWSWEGECGVSRAELLAFAEDPSLHIYRMKGYLRYADGKAILIHKIGSQISIEDASDGGSLPSGLVAIGAKPHFDASRVETAWTCLIRHDRSD